MSTSYGIGTSSLPSTFAGTTRSEAASEKPLLEVPPGDYESKGSASVNDSMEGGSSKLQPIRDGEQELDSDASNQKDDDMKQAIQAASLSPFAPEEDSSTVEVILMEQKVLFQVLRSCTDDERLPGLLLSRAGADPGRGGPGPHRPLQEVRSRPASRHGCQRHRLFP